MDNPMVIESKHLGDVLEALRAAGYQPVGPAVRDGAIVYDVLNSVGDLPAGVTDEQGAGSYRLQTRSDGALFSYTAGAQSWKRFLYPPEELLCRLKKTGKDLEVVPRKEEAPPYAFIGVRPCELHAIAILDRVLLQASHDPFYQARRQKAFLLAMNCTKAGATCFCTSMKTGPGATFGFDLALTEMLLERRHFFLVEAGSGRGAGVLRSVPHRKASDAEALEGIRLVSEAAEHMGRVLDLSDIQSLLYEAAEHPHWERAAKRCLACGNCTMVCPTCFCTTVEDTTNIAGNLAERRRRWDSCFSLDFSYIHGGSVRSSTKARYRHRVTHKFATWIEQFGTPGCVGCGRCITWCPVGLDITEQIRAVKRER